MHTLYNTSFVYCHELAPGTVSLTGGWVRGDDGKQNRIIQLGLKLVFAILIYNCLNFYEFLKKSLFH